jgi:hypothetical protein
MSAVCRDRSSGEKSPEESESRGGRTVGAGVILAKADPDTDWDRVAKWILRAQAEGVVRGCGHD